MKTIALALTLVAVVSAQGLGGGLGGAGAGGPPAAGGAVGGGRQGGAGGLGGLFQRRNWGPRVYGPGVNNQWALPPNPFAMQRALAIIRNVPHALIRVDLDGEISFTNQFGQEADIIHPLGYDLSELIE